MHAKPMCLNITYRRVVQLVTCLPHFWRKIGWFIRETRTRRAEPDRLRFLLWRNGAVRVGALRCFCLVRCAASAESPTGHRRFPFCLQRAPPQARNPSLVIAVRAEGLTLLVADNSTGYFGAGVPRQPWPAQALQAPVTRGGKRVCFLGSFATTEEAALCVARSPEGQAAAAERAAAAPPPTSEEARQQAQAEGLTLRVAKSKTGYFGVYTSSSKNKLGYLAQVRRGGKRVSLGSFATAGEAALCVARSPEGQAGTATALAPPLVNKEDSKGVVPSGAILKEEGAVPPMPLGAFVKNEEVWPRQ